VRLSWTDKSSNEEGFVIERKTTDSDWEEITSVGANVLYYVDILDKYATEFTYRVKSYTSVGKSNESNIVTYITPADPATGLSEDNRKTGITVFPNPVKNQFMIASQGADEMKIYDLNGRLMLAKKHLEQKETIDISNFSCGIYFLHAINGRSSNVLKLVKN
jgi:hypothetical protein